MNSATYIISTIIAIDTVHRTLDGVPKCRDCRLIFVQRDGKTFENMSDFVA